MSHTHRHRNNTTIALLERILAAVILMQAILAKCRIVVIVNTEPNKATYVYEHPTILSILAAHN